MRVWPTIATALEEQGSAALISLVEVEGSAPREPGARLIVTPRGIHGTIGGGALEWEAVRRAEARLGKGAWVGLVSQGLGPELAQCCGGRVRVLTEVFDPSMLGEVRRLAAVEEGGAFETESMIVDDRVERRPGPVPRSRGRVGEGMPFTERFGEDRRPLCLFGAGHVGRAVVMALAPLPFAVRWIDSRADAFPSAVPANVEPRLTSDPAAEVAKASDDAFLLIMTHSHPLDLAIVERALRENRFGYVGLIGSATKRARFASRLRAGGIPEAAIAGLVCPIGVGGITGKAPAVIAAATAAELLQRDEMLRNARKPLAHAPEPSRMLAGRGS
ncbi:MAG: xanthine dehydrogenase accessory protein XdhC [Hyphomicrobiales bacterium]